MACQVTRSFANRACLDAGKATAAYKQLQSEVLRAEKLTKDLKAQIETEKILRQQTIDTKQEKHEEKMEFLKKLNKQLKVRI
ncbi:hypothetical protein TNCV_4593091 [Trichonephila clavipes]|nr:hypothetical protein TNCV_4593091 [Trichonephila clavipes]